MLRTTLLLLLTAWATAADRGARGWFDRHPADTVTEIKTQREFVTDVLPSSCVVVQTSLPACRHLRALEEIQPARPGRIMQTHAPLPRQHQGWRPIIQPSNPVRKATAPLPKATPPVGRMPLRNVTMPTPEPSSFWSNWNIFAPRIETVTSTVVEIVTTQYLDPSTVVTFSVKGCRPSRLPFDLPECHQEKDVPPPLEKDLPMPGKLITAAPEPAPASMDPGLIVMAPIQLVPNMMPFNMDVKDGGKKEVVKEEVKEPVRVVPEKVQKAEKVSMVVGVKEEEEKGNVQIEEDKEPKKE